MLHALLAQLADAHPPMLCRRFANVKSQCGLTPLHFAAAGGHLQAVQSLLQFGACASAQVEWGETYCMWPVGTTPLHIAAAKGHLNISKLMLQAQVRAVAGAAVLLHNVL